jgi:hypothetical protein
MNAGNSPVSTRTIISHKVRKNDGCTRNWHCPLRDSASALLASLNRSEPRRFPHALGGGATARMEEQFILRVPPSVADRIERLMNESAAGSSNPDDASLDLSFSGAVPRVSLALLPSSCFPVTHRAQPLTASSGSAVRERGVGCASDFSISPLASRRNASQVRSAVRLSVGRLGERPGAAARWWLWCWLP